MTKKITFRDLSCCPHHKWTWLTLTAQGKRELINRNILIVHRKQLCQMCSEMRHSSGMQSGVCLPCRADLCDYGIINGPRGQKTEPLIRPGEGPIAAARRHFEETKPKK